MGKAEGESTGVRHCGEGEEAGIDVVRRVLRSGYAEAKELPFEGDDILGLKKGQNASAAPADFGFTHVYSHQR